MPLLYKKFISRDFVRAHPDWRFVFGDNLARSGHGGQAGAMRGEPNAIGVSTKYAPGCGGADYFNNSQACVEHVCRDLDMVESVLIARIIVVWPLDGIGTGLSEWRTRAPRLLAEVDNWLRKMEARYP